MRTGTVVHPDFDPSLPRRLVALTNGRLKGSAGIEFQDYNKYYAERGELTAELWDIDELVPKFEAVLVEGVAVVERARTLELLGRLGQGMGSRQEIRTYASTWFKPNRSDADRWGHVLTGAMLAKEAARQGREDLVSQIAFLLLRAAWENPSSHGRDRAELTVARRLFSFYANQLWLRVSQVDPLDLTMRSASGLDVFVTHPLKAARICECLSLLGLLALVEDDGDLAAKIVDYLESFLNASLGVANIVSDEWAFSVLVLSVFLARTGRINMVELVLKTSAVWILDKIEYGRGLARVGEPPDVVVRQLLGAAYPNMRIPAERSSYGLAVVADLAFVCGLSDLFRDLVNDLDSVNAMASIVAAEEMGAQLVARVEYNPEADLPAAHHRIPVDSTDAGKEGHFFDCLAAWSTMRDRHLPSVIKSIIAMPVD
jgi:hypothetical protein